MKNRTEDDSIDEALGYFYLLLRLVFLVMGCLVLYDVVIMFAGRGKLADYIIIASALFIGFIGHSTVSLWHYQDTKFKEKITEEEGEHT